MCCERQDEVWRDESVVLVHLSHQICLNKPKAVAQKIELTKRVVSSLTWSSYLYDIVILTSEYLKTNKQMNVITNTNICKL